MMDVTRRTSLSHDPRGRLRLPTSSSCAPLDLRPPFFFVLEAGAGESKAADAERFPLLPFLLDLGSGSGAPPIFLWYAFRTSTAPSLKMSR